MIPPATATFAPPRSTAPSSPVSIPTAASNDALRDLLRERQARAAAENAIRGALPNTPPSSAVPPPTPLTSGLRPAGGIPTGSIPTPIAEVPLPSGIPGGSYRPPNPAVGLAAGAGISGLIDAGSRLAAGQSLGHAVTGGLVNAGGSIAGGAIGTAIAGPVGGLVGSMIGGSIASAAFDLLNPPTSTEASQPYTPSPYGIGQEFPYLVRIRAYFVTSGAFAIVGCYGYTVTNEKAADGRTYPFLKRITTPGGPLSSGLIIDPGSISFPDNNYPTNKPDRPGGDARTLPRSSPASPITSSPPSPVGNPLSDAAKLPSGKPADAPTNNLGSNLPALQPVQAPAQGLGIGQGIGLGQNPFNSPIPQPNNRGNFVPSLGGLSSPSPDRIGEAKPPGEPKTAKMTTITPDSLKPSPPKPLTPEEVDKEAIDKLTSLEVQVAAMATAIATLLARPLSPASPIDLNSPEFTNAVATGNCKTTQPGGCMRKEFDDIGNQNLANSGKLDAINAGLQSLDLLGTAGLAAKLDKIDTKLGPQIPGNGISGKLLEMFDQAKDLANKTWDALGLDRVVSVLTMVAAIHNATLLSRDLGETFIEAANSVTRALQATIPGFLKKPDGENLEIDIGEVLGDKLESFLKEMLGVATYNDLKAKWIKSNRILTAGSNMLSAMRGMSNALGDGLEVVGGYVAKGFNGIQKDGLVSDRSWSWMDEDLNFKNPGITRFTNRIDSTEEAVSSVQQIAESVVEFTEEANELVKNTTELKKALDTDTAALAAAEAKKDAESESAEIADDDLLPSGGAS